MIEKLKTDLTKVLRGFLFEEFEKVQSDIGRAVGQVLVNHGHNLAALMISPMDNGFKIRMDFSDKAYSIKVVAESVNFDEIDS